MKNVQYDNRNAKKSRNCLKIKEMAFINGWMHKGAFKWTNVSTRFITDASTPLFGRNINSKHWLEFVCWMRIVLDFFLKILCISLHYCCCYDCINFDEKAQILLFFFFPGIKSSPLSRSIMTIQMGYNNIAIISFIAFSFVPPCVVLSNSFSQ